MTRRVGIVGGGLAGIAAAVACADAGADVVLIESRPRLGGLAGSFRRGELEIDTGAHVFLRCCHAYRALLERLGATDDVHLQDRLDITVHRPGHRPARLRRGGLPAPLQLAGSMARYRPIPLRQRLALGRAALALRSVDPTDPATDERTFAAWLAEHGQGPEAVAALWDLVATATLNASADQASLALAATVFRTGLLTRADASDIGWALVPLGRLHGDTAAGVLARAGATVATGTRVRSVSAAGDGWRIVAGRRGGPIEEIVVDDLICAVPPRAATSILPAEHRGPADDVVALGTAGITDIHVIYDRRVLHPRGDTVTTALDSPVQWMFDRTASSGADRCHPSGPQHLVVSLSAAEADGRRTTAELRERFLPALASLFDAAAAARVLDFFVTREPHATLRPAPGGAARRPGPRPVDGGPVLAGAWTDTGWPSTMEGAVRSGNAAAETVLAGWPGHTDGRRVVAA